MHLYAGATGPRCSAPPKVAAFAPLDYTNFYQSLDGGLTWTGTTIGEQACVSGITRAEIAPSGRIFVLQPSVGIAWSDDSTNWTFPQRVFWGDPSNRSESFTIGNFLLALVPLDPPVVFVDVGYDPTASPYPGHSVARSDDGGLSWQRIGPSFRFDTRVLLVSPSSPDTVVASDGYSGFWRTDDAGQTWANYTQQIPPGALDRAIISPDDSQTLLALNRSPQSPGQVGLWRSDDGGASWRLTYPSRGLYLIAFDPRIPRGNGVVATTTHETLYSSDGGQTFVSLGRPPKAGSESATSTWFTTMLLPVGDTLLVGGSDGIWQTALPSVTP